MGRGRSHQDDDLGAYVREVEARYLELVGRGFAMSARDVGRVMRWFEDGVPLRTVLATLDEAARRRRAQPQVGAEALERLTLGHLERSVAAAMKRRLTRVSAREVPYETQAPDEAREASSGDRSGVGAATLLAAIEVAGGAAPEPVRAVLRRAWLRVAEAEARGEDLWELAPLLDEEVARGLLEALSEAEHRRLEAELTTRCARLSTTASEVAVLEARSFLRARLVRERFAVPELMAVLLARASEEARGATARTRAAATGAKGGR